MTTEPTLEERYRQETGKEPCPNLPLFHSVDYVHWLESLVAKREEELAQSQERFDKLMHAFGKFCESINAHWKGDDHA